VRRQSILRDRVGWAALVAALLPAAVLLTACSSGGGPDKVAPPSAARSATAPLTLKSLQVNTGEVGAVDTILIYCTPGLPGSPRQGCDLGRTLQAVTDAVAGPQRVVAAHPGEAKYQPVSASVSKLNQDVSEVKPCDTWFRAGGKISDTVTNLECDQAWTSLTTDWQTFTAAVHWS
jgi:hypothetical protein